MECGGARSVPLPKSIGNSFSTLRHAAIARPQKSKGRRGACATHRGKAHGIAPVWHIGGSIAFAFSLGLRPGGFVLFGECAAQVSSLTLTPKGAHQKAGSHVISLFRRVSQSSIILPGGAGSRGHHPGRAVRACRLLPGRRSSRHHIHTHAQSFVPRRFRNLLRAGRWGVLSLCHWHGAGCIHARRSSAVARWRRASSPAQCKAHQSFNRRGQWVQCCSVLSARHRLAGSGIKYRV